MKYTYKRKTYNSLYEIRKAFPNIVFPKNPTAEILELLGIKEKAEQVVEPSLDTLKATAKRQTKDNYNRALANLVVESSVGVSANADPKSLENLSALLLLDFSVEKFRDSENRYMELTKEQFITLTKEIAQAQINLKKKKWEIDNTIDTAYDSAELQAISLEF